MAESRRRGSTGIPRPVELKASVGSRILKRTTVEVLNDLLARAPTASIVRGRLIALVQEQLCLGFAAHTVLSAGVPHNLTEIERAIQLEEASRVLTTHQLRSRLVWLRGVINSSARLTYTCQEKKVRGSSCHLPGLDAPGEKSSRASTAHLPGLYVSGEVGFSYMCLFICSTYMCQERKLREC